MPIPEPNLPDVWMMRLLWDGGAVNFMNVFAVEDPISTLTAAQVVDAVRDAFNDAMTNADGVDYRAWLNTNVAAVSLQATRYDESNPSTSFLSLTGAQYAGTSTTDQLPTQCAVAVSLRTGLASRRARGRIFAGGFTNAAAEDDGRMRTSFRTDVENFWNDFRTRLDNGADPVNLVVLSRGWVNEGAQDPRASYAQQAYPVTEMSVRDLVFDTIRSRAA